LEAKSDDDDVETAVTLRLKKTGHQVQPQTTGHQTECCFQVVSNSASYVEVPCSDFGLETDLGFCGFPHYLQANAGIVP
jgi:hypothetical protein